MHWLCSFVTNSVLEVNFQDSAFRVIRTKVFLQHVGGGKHWPTQLVMIWIPARSKRKLKTESLDISENEKK